MCVAEDSQFVPGQMQWDMPRAEFVTYTMIDNKYYVTLEMGDCKWTDDKGSTERSVYARGRADAEATWLITVERGGNTAGED